MDRGTVWICALAALGLGACSEGKSALSPDASYVPTPPAEAPTAPQTPRRLRRLSNVQIENVLADVLGARIEVSKGFLTDPRVDGYDNDVVALGISDSKVDEIATAAERAAAYIIDPAHLGRYAPCAPGAPTEPCARDFAAWVAGQAWGRPPREDEVTRLAEVFRVADDYPTGIGLIAEAVFQSPHFVYTSELGDADGVLTAPEIAAELSLFIAGTRPDAPLSAAAAAGELATPDGRAKQARRLLVTPAARSYQLEFFRRWLVLNRDINKDLGAFPLFTPTVRLAVNRELDTFITHVLAEGTNRLDELMLADYTFSSPVLAPIYNDDLLATPGDFTRVELKPYRRGLLALPAFLAVHARVDQTNPIERGLLVRTRLLCQDIPPPPPDVAAQTPSGPELTTRQKYEAHAKDARCRACHQFMDPIGFGFEQFDVLGRYRTTENAVPVDARGELVGTDVDGPFVGPAELADRLVKSATFRRCFVRQLWRFAEGRAITTGDEREIDYLAWAFESAEHRIDDLLVALVKKPTFITRRAAEVQP
jgi:hypothetical protein